MNEFKPPRWLWGVGLSALIIGLGSYAMGHMGSSGEHPLYTDVSMEQLEAKLAAPTAVPLPTPAPGTSAPPAGPDQLTIKQLHALKRNRDNFPSDLVLEWTSTDQRAWRAHPATQADFDRTRTEARDHKVSIKEEVLAEESNAIDPAFIMMIALVVGGLGLPVILMLMMGRAQGGPGGHAAETVNKSVGHWIKPEDLTETFDDVAGIDEVVDDLQLLVEMLKDPARIKDKFGGNVPRGALFEGGPGTGKTLCARVIARMAGVPFFTIAGSSFEEMYVGLGAARARKMFEEAEQKGVCLIFIDEIDAVGRKRQNGPGGVGDATLNQLLVLMDGFQKSKAIVIAATNRSDILDEALLRRLPWKIGFPNPDQPGRLKILGIHARNKPVRREDLVNVAATTQGFSGDALRNALNEAAIASSQRTRYAQAAIVATGATQAQAELQVPNEITSADLFEGLLRHLMGPARKNIQLNVRELISTDIHELFGHAFCCAYQHRKGRTEDVVRFVTIQPRSRAGGLAFITPERDLHFHSESYVHSQAVTAFGGSAAELEILNQKTSGIDNDFEKAYSSIHRAVSRWGMSDKVGILSVGQNGRTAATEVGETMRDDIDAECKRIGNEMHAEARRIVRMCAQSEFAWQALEELLKERILTQDRFNVLFEKVFADIESHPEWEKIERSEAMFSAYHQRVDALAAKYKDKVEVA